MQAADTNIQYNGLIKEAQQHVTALASPPYLFPAAPQLMSSLNEVFATRGVVNAVLPDAAVLAAGVQRETAHKVHG